MARLRIGIMADQATPPDPREGSPSDIGYQHGYLLANEIDTALQMMSYYMPHATNRDWNFYRNAAEKRRQLHS